MEKSNSRNVIFTKEKKRRNIPQYQRTPKNNMNYQKFLKNNFINSPQMDSKIKKHVALLLSSHSYYSKLRSVTSHDRLTNKIDFLSSQTMKNKFEKPQEKMWFETV